MGWAAWFVRFYFRVLPTPRSVLGPEWSLFARLFAFLPSCRPPHSVRGNGLGNRAAKQRHGTVGFSCSFFCRPADALLRSEPGDGQGNLATHTVAQDCMFCLLFLRHVVLFSLCYAFSSRHFPPLVGLWVVPPFHFVLVFASCLAPAPRPRWQPAGGF